MPAMPATPPPVSDNRYVRALDQWLLVTLILVGALAQLGWTIASRGSSSDSSRPGRIACVFLQTNHKERLATGTKCNAIHGFCEVTKDTTCSEIGSVPYIGGRSH